MKAQTPPPRTLLVGIGNTTLFCGVYSGRRRRQVFRLPNGAMAKLPRRIRGKVDAAVICSVVPKLTGPLVILMRREWKIRPHVLGAASPHGLTIDYRRPRELGTDRLAAAIGARAAFPGKNLVIVDCGTATTVTALRGDGTLLGGAILPGLALWSETLARRTAQLPNVPLVRPRCALGRSAREGIASGVYFGHCGAVRAVVAQIAQEAFGRAGALVVGTGGHAGRLRDEKLFSVIKPELVLSGLLHVAHKLSSHA